jgi:hypothetical protein
VHVQRFNPAPSICVASVAAQAFSDERSRIGNVGNAGVHGKCARIPNEVIDGLGV